jgi:hypothetical protein
MKQKGIYDIQFFYCGQVDIIDYAVEKKVKVVESLSAGINVVARRHTEEIFHIWPHVAKDFT